MFTVEVVIVDLTIDSITARSKSKKGKK